MIFVNDVDGVENIPEWIKHVDANTDGLGFADTIFPAFLFIVGLSLPFAIKNRINKGHSFTSIGAYIVTRSFALLVMGFLHVNLENYSNSALLPLPVWEILVTICFFLIWLDYPKTMDKRNQYSLQAIGIALLVVLAFLFQGEAGGQPTGLKPYWWGILGLIGWSYLICAIIFLLAKERLLVLVSALLFFLFFNLASHAGWLTVMASIRPYFWIVGNAAMPAFTMGGVVISVLYTQLTGKNRGRQFWNVLFIIGIAFFIFGFLTRPFGGISKIRDTPSWVGICNGINILVFGLMIYLVDLKEKQRWFRLIRPAGTSTLTCYLLPYLLYSIYNLFNIQFPSFLNEGAGGILRSFATAFVVIFIAGLLERKRIRLSV